MPPTIYDTIGRQYGNQRRPDPRIARQLLMGLGDARSVLNVGAGTGSYEPLDRTVVAVEPSAVMVSQRAADAAPAVRAQAEALPFRDQSFDAVMAVLTLHHWTDRIGGLAECARVARQRAVLLTWDPDANAFWLVRDYLPGFAVEDRRRFPKMTEYADGFGPGVRVDISPVPVPHDCQDGFLGAYWARPSAYLDPAVQSGISSFAQADARPGLSRLADDLASGAWQARYGDLLKQDTEDLGYRLVTAYLPDRSRPELEELR